MTDSIGRELITFTEFIDYFIENRSLLDFIKMPDDEELPDTTYKRINNVYYNSFDLVMQTPLMSNAVKFGCSNDTFIPYKDLEWNFNYLYMLIRNQCLKETIRKRDYEIIRLNGTLDKVTSDLQMTIDNIKKDPYS